MEYYIQHGGGRKYMAPSPSPYLVKASNICSWSLWIFYICFQFEFVTLNFGVSTHWQIYISLLAEIFITLPEMLFLLGTTFTIWKLSKSNEARKSYYLVGDAAPTIDVFVTCAGEPINTVVDTLRAAIAQDYPTAKFECCFWTTEMTRTSDTR